MSAEVAQAFAGGGPPATPSKPAGHAEVCLPLTRTLRSLPDDGIVAPDWACRVQDPPLTPPFSPGDENRQSMADAEEPKGSDPRRKLTFNDMPRLGRPAMDSQLERIRACSEDLSLFPYSQTYRETVATNVKMLLVEIVAGQRRDVDDGLAFFNARPSCGYDLPPLVQLKSRVPESIPRPVFVYNELTSANLAALGYGCSDGGRPYQYRPPLTVKLQFDADKPAVGAQADPNPAALEKHKLALAQVDAKIVSAKTVSAQKNAARKEEIMQYLEQQKAAFMEFLQKQGENSEGPPMAAEDSEEEPDEVDSFRRLEGGIFQEMDMITRAEEYTGDQDSTPFPIAPPWVDLALVARSAEAADVDLRIGRHNLRAVAPFGPRRLEGAAEALASGVYFAGGSFSFIPTTSAEPSPLAAEYAAAALQSSPDLTAAQHLALGFGRSAHELTAKISLDTEKPTVGVQAKPDPAVIEKHEQGLSKLDDKIAQSRKAASAKNAQRKEDLAKFLAEQRAEKTPANDAEDSGSEQGVSEPDDDFLHEVLEAGVAQELEIIERAEERKASNTLAFPGLRMGEEELAAQAGPSWVEAKQAGLTEWGIEHKAIAGDDANEQAFPCKSIRVKHDLGDLDVVDQRTDDEGKPLEGGFEPVEVEEAVDPATLNSKPASEEDPMSFEMPEDGYVWKTAPEPTPLSEEELKSCEAMFVRDSPDMFSFELPGSLTDVVPEGLDDAKNAARVPQAIVTSANPESATALLEAPAESSTSLEAPVSVPTTEFVAEQPSAPEMAEAESAKAKQHSDAILVS